MSATPAPPPDPAALWHALASEQRALVLRAAQATHHEGGEAYLVGGPVRDLLRGESGLRDIDLTTTVDARRIAERFATDMGATVAKTTAFGTATIEVRDAEGGTHSIDIATTRTETYPWPGALPVVRFPARITDDLARRDFTINAMALPISDIGFGPLLDPYHGLADLRAGRMRILHEASFRDDPTRLYRATRYAARFGFTLEAETAALFRDALANGALDTISADRKRHELELGQQEQDNIAAFAAFDASGLLRATSPVLAWDAWIARRLRLIAPRTILMWAFFVCRQDDTAIEHLITDLRIETMNDATRRFVRVWRERDAIASAPRLSVLFPLLNGLPEREVLALLDDEPAAARVAVYYARLRQLHQQDGRWGRSFGEYLKALGVPPGPVYREPLFMLREARVDGDVDTLDAAKDFLRRYIEEHDLKP